jgi:peptidoglycan/xylan/chitin deacetylase (PgdA/CDA1 family)
MKTRFISLLYHDVLSDADPDSSGFSGPVPAEYKLSLREFENHLEAISVSLLLSHRTMYSEIRTQALKPAPVLLTFDDGGVSAHNTIAPLLEARKWRGYFFITTDMIGKPGFMDAKQIRDLYAAGHIIGSHSASHPERITDCTDAELEKEWGESTAVLSDILGRSVDVASIPGGFFSRRVAAAASRAGIRTLFTSEPLQSVGSVDNAVLVGRFSIQRGDPASLPAEFIASNPTRRFRAYTYWNTKKLAKTIAGPAYRRFGNIYMSRK